MKKFLLLALMPCAVFISSCHAKTNNAAENTADAIQADTISVEKYKDIIMAAPDGKVIKVSDYVGKNKYTLIDFWASWCGPCMREMPNVVKAYERYHAKGFEVVGVSLDKDKERWVEAIVSMNLSWPHMSDLKGWQNAGAVMYGVRSIPSNVLVDTDGNIVAKNLRDEELQETLGKLFAE